MSTFVSTATLPLANGVGIVGHRVFDDSVPAIEIFSRTTAGVTLLFNGDGYGIYQATIVVPDNVTKGTVLWDDGSGHAIPQPFSLGFEGLPEIPGINIIYTGPVLTTKEEIERLYSTIGVELRLDDLDTDNQTAMMNEIVVAATETLASYTLRFYNTSDLINSQWARRRATIIGAYYLSLRRANGAQFVMEYQRVMEELEKFLTATPPFIPDVPVRTSNVPTASSYIVDDRNRYRKLRVKRDYSTQSYPGRYDYLQPLNRDYF